MNREGSNPHALGIDHLLFVAGDLDQSAPAFERLGFTVSPRGVHSPHLGNANHTIMLDRDYLELIGVLTPTPLNQLHRDNLRLGEGCHTAAITTNSIAGTLRALQRSGIEMDSPVSFSRPVELPQGFKADAEFEVVRPSRRALPNGFMFFCNHRTPDRVWIGEWMVHANTARRIAAVVIASDDPSATADIYGMLFADPAQRSVDGGVLVKTGKADLEFLLPQSIASRYAEAGVGDVGSPYFKVVRIGVDSLATARTVLELGAVPFIEQPEGSFVVPPSYGCGTILEFIEPGAPG